MPAWVLGLGGAQEMCKSQHVTFGPPLHARVQVIPTEGGATRGDAPQCRLGVGNERTVSFLGLP